MRTALAIPAALLASACAIAPGMKMNEGAAVERGRARTGDPDFRVHPITPETLARLASQVTPPPTIPDPLAAEAASYEYAIARDDVLQVVVWDHPELTTPSGQFRSPEENGIVVSPNGTMYFPHVGVIHVAGLTVEQVREILTERLARVIKNPQLDVRVVAFRGRKVQVTGEVVQPTPVPITNVPLRVQDAIAAARGFTPEADWANVTLSRQGKTYHLNLQAMYERGDVSQNWLLMDGDVLHVGDRTQNKVFIVGEVRTPRSQVMVKGRMTLAEALTDATGGWDQSVANTGKIYVFRGNFEAPSIFRLDASSPDALLLATQFQLRPKDVVYVSTYEISRFNRVILQILPTIQGLFQAVDLAERSSNFIETGELQSD